MQPIIELVLISFFVHRGNPDKATCENWRYILMLLLSFSIIWRACDKVHLVSHLLFASTHLAAVTGGLLLLPACLLTWKLQTTASWSWVATRIYFSLVIFAAGIAIAQLRGGQTWAHQSEDAPVFTSADILFLSTKWALVSLLRNLATST